MLGHLVSNAAFPSGMNRAPQDNLLRRLWALLFKRRAS